MSVVAVIGLGYAGPPVVIKQTVKNMIAAGSYVKGDCFVDVKACFDEKALEGAGVRVWRL